MWTYESLSLARGGGVGCRLLFWEKGLKITIGRWLVLAKSKYNKWVTEDGLLLISGWARDGLSMDDIAHNIGVTKQTLYNWAERSAEFAQALRESREVADRVVENALFKRAVGYRYSEITRIRDETGNLIQEKEVVREMPPDTAAQIFWLRNRMKDSWSNNPQPSGDKALNKLDEIIGGIDAIANK